MSAKSRAKRQAARVIARGGGAGTTSPPSFQPLSVIPDWADGDGVYGAATTRYDGGPWPGYRTTADFIATDEYTHTGLPYGGWLHTSDFPWDVGGMPGAVGRFGYTTGVVASANVENFELTGRVVRVRRPPEGNRGPVGTRDYAGGYLSAYAQSFYHGTPDELLYPDIGGAI